MQALPREPGLIPPEEVWEGLLEDATLEPNLKSGQEQPDKATRQRHLGHNKNTCRDT